MLETVPTMQQMSIQEYEERLERIRSRRLSALFEYQTIQIKELDIQGNKVAAQLAKQYEMLGKELVRLEDLINKCEGRVNKVSALKDELELVRDLKEALNQ